MSLDDFIEAIRIDRAAKGRPLPAACLYVEQSGHASTALIRSFRPEAGRDEVVVGHAYAEGPKIALSWAERETWIRRLAEAGLYFNDTEVK